MPDEFGKHGRFPFGPAIAFSEDVVTARKGLDNVHKIPNSCIVCQLWKMGPELLYAL
jgi:hypothetical protein